ncbi:MAG TPA: WXG100 family type VII secretion target [Mycobacterium sp.]
MSQTSLTPADAHAKITQIDDAMNSARQLGRNMQDITQQMTSSSWLGNQASVFAQKMAQYDDDFNAIVNRLTQVADTGKSNMTALANLDSE